MATSRRFAVVFWLVASGCGGGDGGNDGGGDRHVYAGRTRFIAPSMLPVFEQVTWPEASEQGADSAQPQAPVMQVRARARAAWR